MDSIGARAVQSVSIDVANLTARLAVSNAYIDDVVEQVAALDQSQWRMTRLTDPENGQDTGYEVVIPGLEFDKLTTVLALIQSLQ